MEVLVQLPEVSTENPVWMPALLGSEHLRVRAVRCSGPDAVAKIVAAEGRIGFLVIDQGMPSDRVLTGFVRDHQQAYVLCPVRADHSPSCRLFQRLSSR